ncbi:MAG: lysylphosphatidylglycerol synthase transmembrane domain-containing protein [Candidatus Micrarchaeota archaeon]
MDKKILVAINALVAVALLWVLLSSVNLSVLAETLAKVNPAWLLAAAVFYVLMNAMSAFRIKHLLGELAKEIPFSKVFLSHMSAMLLSDVTPGRVGYSYLVLRLRKYGLRGGNSTKVLGVVLASDFFVRALLVIASVYLFSQFLLTGVILAVFSLCFLALFFKRIAWFEKLLAKIPSVGARLAGAYAMIFEHTVSKTGLLASVGISFIGSILRGFAWLFIAISMGATGNPIDFAVLCALLTSVSFIPVSIAGLGVQESIGAWLFSLVVGWSFGQATAFMLLVRVVEAGSDLVFGGWDFLKRSS